MAAFASEGIACLVGGFSWAWDVNLKRADDLTAVDWSIVSTIVLGMAGEGAALVAAGRALDPTASADRARRWRDGAAAAWALACVHVTVCARTGARGTLVLQPAGLPVLLGLGSLAVACAQSSSSSGGGRGRDRARDGIGWTRVSGGTVLCLAGAAVVAAFDNRCSGTSCLSELFPWEPSPCAAGVSDLASCPLPAGFNHAVRGGAPAFRLPRCGGELDRVGRRNAPRLPLTSSPLVPLAVLARGAYVRCVVCLCLQAIMHCFAMAGHYLQLTGLTAAGNRPLGKAT